MIKWIKEILKKIDEEHEWRKKDFYTYFVNLDDEIREDLLKDPYIKKSIYHLSRHLLMREKDSRLGLERSEILLRKTKDVLFYASILKHTILLQKYNEIDYVENNFLRDLGNSDLSDFEKLGRWNLFCTVLISTSIKNGRYEGLEKYLDLLGKTYYKQYNTSDYPGEGVGFSDYMGFFMLVLEYLDHVGRLDELEQWKEKYFGWLDPNIDKDKQELNTVLDSIERAKKHYKAAL